jgi:hypothetical protein
MTHSPATQQYKEKQAGDLQPGDFVFPPGDGPAAEIRAVEVKNDDYGVPALLLVTTVDGGSISVAVGSSVPVGDGVPAGPGAEASVDAPAEAEPDTSSPAEAEADAPAGPAVVVPPRPETPPAYTGPSAEELALIPEPDGTPEAVVRAAAAQHKGKNGVQVLAERLAKGINTKSGSCLRDLSDLAFDLCIVLRDPDHALAVVRETRLRGGGEVFGHGKGDGTDGELRECQGTEVLFHVPQEGCPDGLAVEDAARNEVPDHVAIGVALEERADFVHIPERIQPDRNGLHITHGEAAAGFEEVLI